MKARIARAREFTLRGKIAECEFTLERKEAVIRIMDPIDYDPDCIVPHDIEQALVHELVHLHLGAWETDLESIEQIAKEQAIHALSTALVELARKDDQNGEKGEKASSG